MADLRFRLTASHRDDLAAACALGEEGLNRVAEQIASAEFTIRRSKIERIIHETIGEAQGTVLCRIIFGIAGSFRRSFLSAEESLESVTLSLGDSLKNDVRFQNWNECRSALRNILETRSVKLAAKALDISYDFERVHLAGRILTSVRPVFDDLRTNVVGSTVVQTLRLEYLQTNGEQSSISIAMDMEDIKKLQEECERAIVKAAAVKSEVESGCRFEAIIPGEERDE